jgi:PadR family transcriptional regulator PadR
MGTGGDHMEDETAIIGGLVQELRRGSLVLVILSQLASEQYGYSLVQQIEEKGLKLEPGTLYPLLRRLERQGLLDSKWDTDTSRPRRYYQLSRTGRSVLAAMIEEWRDMSRLMNKLLPDGVNP